MTKHLRMTEEEFLARQQKRPDFKLTHPVEPESSVLTVVLRALELHPRVGWAQRMNSGAGKFLYPDGRTSQFIRFGFPGMSDILGQMKDGRFLACETKSAVGVVSDDQDAFLELVARCGGVAFVARNIDDVMRALS